MKNPYIKVCISDAKQSGDRLIYDIPPSWTINKLKCLCATEIPALKFDDFELGHEGKLLQGTQVLNSMQSQNIDHELQLSLIKTASKTKFVEYYNSTMNKLFNEQILTNFPVMSPGINMGQSQNKEQEQQNQANALIIDIYVIWNSIKFIGIYGFLLILFGQGNLYHCSVVCLVVCVYCVLELYKKHRKREKIFEKYLKELDENKNKQEFENFRKDKSAKIELIDDFRSLGLKKTNHQIRIIHNMILRAVIGYSFMIIFKILEMVLCFVMTIYPNWRMKDHLELMDGTLQRWKILVNCLLPESYEQTDNKDKPERKTN